MSDHEIPDGMREDAHASWPPQGLIESFLGKVDFEFRAGEHVAVPADDEAAQATARKFRDVLGRYASGVTVVTTLSGGEPMGMTCQSFTSVSLDPPLVAFLPMKTSRAFAAIRNAGRFCVNFLAADQADVSNAMASRAEDKFAGVAWSESKTGSPLLEGIVGYVDCTVHAIHEAGDHYIVIGRVQDLDVAEAQDPLLFYQGKYRTTTTP